MSKGITITVTHSGFSGRLGALLYCLVTQYRSTVARTMAITGNASMTDGRLKSRSLRVGGSSSVVVILACAVR
jgi:hypothetical protein